MTRAEKVALIRRQRKELLVGLLGGQCIVCGYCKSVAALDFHHLDRTSKTFNLTNGIASRSIKDVLIETGKCILLCANCHREFENGLIELPSINPDFQKAIEESINKCKIKQTTLRMCKTCNKEFSVDLISSIRKYCSQQCSSIGQRKVVRPSKEELLLDRSSGLGLRSMGKKYGVTDNAVKKWLIKYGVYDVSG